MSVPSRVDGAAQRRRVAVVDNDPVMRAGTAAVLCCAPGIDLVASVDHDTARGWSSHWAGVDVAVVDASDHRRAGDQFPGVAVVSAIRTFGSDVTVVVLTGQYLHPGLRRRMWEAGADFFYPRDEGMSVEELISVVTNPDDHRRLRHRPQGLPDELGVTPATRVNDVVDRLTAAGLHEALASSSRKKSDPHGTRSRWWNRVRELASGPSGLTPVKAGGEPAVHLDAPSVVQLRKFWAAMARAGAPPAE